MIIIMLGAPGSGKGTLAKGLSEKYNVPHVSTGDMLREQIAQGDELGKQIASLINKGNFVPDEMMYEILVKRLNKKDCLNGFILDGFPRDFNQIELLNEALDKLGKKIDIVLNMELADEKIVERISNRLVCQKCREIYNIKNKPPKVENICDVCGAKLNKRKDDEPDVVRERLKIYHNNCEEILNYYEKNSTIKNVISMEKLEDTLANAIKILDEIEEKK